MTYRTYPTVLALLGVLLLGPTAVRAANLGRAGINLGSTSFYDGFGRPDEGFTYQMYLKGSASRSLVDRAGRDKPAFDNPEIDALVWTHQLSYFFSHELLDAPFRPALNVLIPTVGYRSLFGPNGAQLQDNGVGLSDLIVGPMFQFDPIRSGNRAVLSHRFEVDLFIPVGKYDRMKNINQGTNFFSINPHWAITLVPLPDLEFTVRLQYMHNFRNPNPAPSPDGEALRWAVAGDVGWVNFATSYAPVHGLHLGINGYFLRQLSQDTYRSLDGRTATGNDHGDGMAQALGIGPGLLWVPNQDNRIFVNGYGELLVRDRPVNSVLNMRWIHSF